MGTNATIDKGKIEEGISKILDIVKILKDYDGKKQAYDLVTEDIQPLAKEMVEKLEITSRGKFSSAELHKKLHPNPSTMNNMALIYALAHGNTAPLFGPNSNDPNSRKEDCSGCAKFLADSYNKLNKKLIKFIK